MVSLFWKERVDKSLYTQVYCGLRSQGIFQRKLTCNQSAKGPHEAAQAPASVTGTECALTDLSEAFSGLSGACPPWEAHTRLVPVAHQWLRHSSWAAFGCSLILQWETHSSASVAKMGRRIISSQTVLVFTSDSFRLSSSPFLSSLPGVSLSQPEKQELGGTGGNCCCCVSSAALPHQVWV